MNAIEFVRVLPSELTNKKAFILPDGMIDVVTDTVGMGHISYDPGLLCSVRKKVTEHVYRFKVPPTAKAGAEYGVRVSGAGAIQAFNFSIQAA
jgi:hypothetical protein